MAKKQDRHYEELYNKLLDRSETLHESNKKRIRIGLIILAVLPFIMIDIRWLTGSDKAVFLIIWVILMFAICIYLISVEFIDDSIQKTLREVTEKEADLGELLPDSEEVHERIHDRISQKKARVRDE